MKASLRHVLHVVPIVLILATADEEEGDELEDELDDPDEDQGSYEDYDGE